MKHSPAFLILLLMVTGLGSSQTPSPTPLPEPKAPPQATQASPPKPTPAVGTAAPASDLHSVLAQMDKAGATFKSAQADIELVQYTKLVKDTDVKTGQIFFRRKGSDTEVALHVLKPHGKQVVIKDGKLTFYDEMTHQTTMRDITSNRADVESFMNLGFGGRSQELLKDYQVKLVDWETVDGIETAKLELVARKESVKRLFSKVILWIDPKRDVAIQQQRFESSGDYQLAHYTDIKLKEKIPDHVFTIKKTGRE